VIVNKLPHSPVTAQRTMLNLLCSAGNLANFGLHAGNMEVST
jgi:hypothetical protein